MAMRGPRSSDVRSRVVVRPVYEDFKPMFEWKQEESSDVLIVYLPGFMKEYLKVTIEGRNIVRVRGERLLAGNKWSRFQEDYQIPEQCNVTGIRAKFERGILTVTMPRKNITVTPKVEVAPKIEPKRTQEALSPKEATTKTIPQKNTTTNQEEKGHEKSHTSPKKGDQEVLEPPRPQNVTNERRKSPQDAIIKEEEFVTESKGKHREISPKTLEKTARDEKAKEPTKDESSVFERKENMSTERKGKGSELLERRSQNAAVEEEKKSVGKKKESIEGNVAKTKIEKGEILEGKLKETSTDNKESKLDYFYKKVVMGGKNEERQLLVNMGVAVLVIVALGAYVSYTYGSSAKAKH